MKVVSTSPPLSSASPRRHASAPLYLVMERGWYHDRAPCTALQDPATSPLSCPWQIRRVRTYPDGSIRWTVFHEGLIDRLVGKAASHSSDGGTVQIFAQKGQNHGFVPAG